MFVVLLYFSIFSLILLSNNIIDKDSSVKIIIIDNIIIIIINIIDKDSSIIIIIIDNIIIITTDPRFIPNREQVELSYDKRQSVLMEDQRYINELMADAMLYN